MPQIIAVANQKGGVGKSTTAYHLSLAADTAGLRTLVVDADPQGNLTRAIGPNDLSPKSVSLADVLAPQTEVTIEDILTDTAWENLVLAPAGGDNLAAIEQVIAGHSIGRETYLREALAPVAERFDLILIDCNPSISLLTVNALVAANHALIVTRPDMWSLDGLGRLFTSITEMRKHYNPELGLPSVLVNQFESRTKQARFWVEQLREQAEAGGVRMLHPFVPKRQIIADSIEAGAHLNEYGTAGRELADLYAAHLSTLTQEN
jgi:chromosome partitioning protein